MSWFRLIVSQARRLGQLLLADESDRGSAPHSNAETAVSEALGEYREALRIAFEQSRYLDGLVARTANFIIVVLTGRAVAAALQEELRLVDTDAVLYVTALLIAGLLCVAAFATRSFIVPKPETTGGEDREVSADERLRLHAMCVDNARESNFHKRTILLITWMLVMVAISLFTLFQVLKLEFERGFWSSVNAWGVLVAITLPSLVAVAFLLRQLYKAIVVQPAELSNLELVVNLEGEGFPAKIWQRLKTWLKTLLTRRHRPPNSNRPQSEL